MKFSSEDHESFYNAHKDIAERSNDYAALVYTFGINETCRKHFSDLYDIETRSIKPAAIEASWQTETSRKITRLAFNLFAWEIVEGDSAQEYAPKAYLMDSTQITGRARSMQFLILHEVK